MRLLSKQTDFVVILCAVSWFVPNGVALGQPAEIEVAEPYEITRIYADEAGVSHFGITEIAFELTDFAPPAPPMSVSQGMKAEGVTFISSPVGWYGSWHPTPVRQIIFCLTGELEVQVSDGEIQTFGPGSVALVEDTDGRGHISRVVGTERVFMAAVPMKAGLE